MKTQVISFSCVLKNRLGETLSSTFQREVVNRVENSGCLEDLAAGLQNVKAGERRQISIRAERAYGYYDHKLVADLPRSELSRGQRLEVGDSLSLYSEELKAFKNFNVIAANEEFVTLDGNHPFAGQDLLFDVEILEARDFSDSEEDVFDGVSLPRSLH